MKREGEASVKGRSYMPPRQVGHCVQYLRGSAMLEMIYYDPNNVQLPRGPVEIQCT